MGRSPNLSAATRRSAITRSRSRARIEVAAFRWMSRSSARRPGRPQSSTRAVASLAGGSSPARRERPPGSRPGGAPLDRVPRFARRAGVDGHPTPGRQPATDPLGVAADAHLSRRCFRGRAGGGGRRRAGVGAEGVGFVFCLRGISFVAPAAFFAVALLPLGGHAAAVEPRAGAELADVLHVASACIWAGGIMALATLHPPDGWRGLEAKSLLDR